MFSWCMSMADYGAIQVPVHQLLLPFFSAAAAQTSARMTAARRLVRQIILATPCTSSRNAAQGAKRWSAALLLQQSKQMRENCAKHWGVQVEES